MEWFSAIVTSITAIIVALIGAWQMKDSKTRKLEAEIAAAKEKEKAEEEKKIENKINNIAENVNSMQASINEITTEQKSIKEELVRVTHLTKYNLEYSQEINNALVNLSERIIDEESDELLRKVMKDHRDKTTELQKKLFEITTQDTIS